MPVTKPTLAEARWAETGAGVAAANITNPTSGARDTGYLANAPVPSGILNKILHELFDWAKYLDDLANQAITWAGAHIFNGPVTFNGTVTITPTIRYIGAGGQPAFQNSWGSISPKICFWKDAFGDIHIAGSGTGPGGSVAFTLPVGFRPVADTTFMTYYAGFLAHILVKADGTVTPENSSSSFEPIIFRADLTP